MNTLSNSAKLFKQILQLNPEYYRAYLALGICCEKMHNLRGSKRFYKKYLQFCGIGENYREVSKRLKELNFNKYNYSELKLI